MWSIPSVTDRELASFAGRPGYRLVHIKTIKRPPSISRMALAVVNTNSIVFEQNCKRSSDFAGSNLVQGAT